MTAINTKVTGTTKDGKLKEFSIGGEALDPPTCDQPGCGRTFPAIRQGGVECHHDGTYTPLTAPTVLAELEEWRALGRDMIGVTKHLGQLSTLIVRASHLLEDVPAPAAKG